MAQRDPDLDRGVYPKYVIRRTDYPGAEEKHHACFRFVLDLNHDPMAVAALRAYITAARDRGYLKLADELEGHLRERTSS